MRACVRVCVRATIYEHVCAVLFYSITTQTLFSTAPQRRNQVLKRLHQREREREREEKSGRPLTLTAGVRETLWTNHMPRKRSDMYKDMVSDEDGKRKLSAVRQEEGMSVKIYQYIKIYHILYSL